MKKLIGIAILLLVLHTLEEVAFHFWQSDLVSIVIAKAINTAPEVVYWVGQIILYLFLILLFLTKSQRFEKWGSVVLGILLILEVEHVIASLFAQQYESGLLTGAILAIYGIFFIQSRIRQRGKLI